MYYRNLKTDWEKYYATQPDICSYLQKTAEEHNLNQFVKYNHEVMSCDFLDDKGKWRVTVMPNNDPSKIFTEEADFLINGSGILNNWAWPDIPGFLDFKGVSCSSNSAFSFESPQPLDSRRSILMLTES